MSNIISKRKYRKGMKSGIHQISELIKPTFGGSGVNIIVESNLYPYSQTTNDAQTMIQAVDIKGKAERVVGHLLKELCDRQDKLLGNGRKTTILMADKILRKGNKFWINKNILKRELDALIPFIESEIDKQTKQITVDEVESVATTASENPDTGKLLQEIYQKIGKNGIIQCEGSGTYDTYYRFIDGVRFDMAGMLSSSMVHDEQAVKDNVPETKAVYEKPLILVTKKKIQTDEDINPLLNEMVSSGTRDLVIFTQDMDSSVATMLVELHKKHTLNICIIRVPSLWRDFYFEDFAKCVGATIIEDSTGKTFKNMHLTDLGSCDKIIIDAEETILIGTKDISAHIAQLQAKGDDDSKLRLNWLTNKTAILKLGSNSETDLSLKRLKCNDAIRSSEMALKYGIVKGGGLCLKEVSKTLPNTTAGKIMKRALLAPYKQNIANGVKNIPESVIDASMVVKKAVRHAVGLASTVITASSLIHLPDKTPEEMQYEIAMNKNNPF